MQITDFTLAIILSVALSLLFAELFGISPGGMISAAYLALVLDTPATVLLVFFVSLLTFLIVKYLLPRFVILYGRRQFVAMVLVAVALKLLCEVLYMFFPFAVLEYRGIGVIVPALIASYCAKQGILVTVGSVLGVTVLVFGIMNLVYFFV